ncbi:MipA/OmpV family protein [Thalassotalea sp. ND16A]|uniref:MipA/OmpV family protein n=1 Tax=Thalassotalea sp. ND16A TaxID=1535422 RepID=UPI00051A7E8F|nr:MipA/OmpV family protein [Thalassotalea sp. ND16A]KGJ90518.1 hypothetical protein ND16A_1914 [Thalassotalea sp. ND16A]
MPYLRHLLLITLTFASGSSLAEEQTLVNDSHYRPVSEWLFGVSVGYGKLINPLNEQDDIPLYFIPDIRYYDERFSIENLDISYNLYQRKNLIVDLVGKQNLDGLYFPGKNRNVVGSLSGIPGIGQVEDGDEIEIPVPTPEQRSLSYLAGVELRYYGYLDYQLLATTDISNVHHGEELRAAVHKLLLFDAFIVELEAGLSFKSEQLTQYYYGFEAPIGVFEQNLYRPESALNYHIKLDLSYAYSQDWYLVSTIRNEWLDSSIANSPIVAKDEILSFFIGIKHIF